MNNEDAQDIADPLGLKRAFAERPHAVSYPAGCIIEQLHEDGGTVFATTVRNSKAVQIIGLHTLLGIFEVKLQPLQSVLLSSMLESCGSHDS